MRFILGILVGLLLGAGILVWLIGSPQSAYALAYVRLHHATLTCTIDNYAGPKK